MCERNYCEGGIQVIFQGSHHLVSELHGHYEIQPIYVNNRPYFKMKKQGIWWSSGFWFIGPHKAKGQTKGYAYHVTEDYCPHQLKNKNWTVSTNQGLIYEQKLSITCK